MELRRATLTMTIVLPIIAIATSQAPGDPRILSAYSDQSVVFFESPDSINWQPLLPDSLKPETLNRDPDRRRELREHATDFGSTEVTYYTSAPASLSKRFYYLLDSTGIRQIRPTTLKGLADIVWHKTGDSVEQTTTYGYAASRIASNGGFLLVARQPLELKLEPSGLSADSLLGMDDPYRGTPFRKIIRQYGIRRSAPQADRWIFVQWLADSAGVEASCTYRFAFFHLGAKPAQVGSTEYGCDV